MERQDSNPGLLDAKRERYILCYLAPLKEIVWLLNDSICPQGWAAKVKTCFLSIGCPQTFICIICSESKCVFLIEKVGRLRSSNFHAPKNNWQMATYLRRILADANILARSLSTEIFPRAAPPRGAVLRTLLSWRNIFGVGSSSFDIVYKLSDAKTQTLDGRVRSTNDTSVPCLPSNNDSTWSSTRLDRRALRTKFEAPFSILNVVRPSEVLFSCQVIKLNQTDGRRRLRQRRRRLRLVLAGRNGRADLDRLIQVTNKAIWSQKRFRPFNFTA